MRSVDSTMLIVGNVPQYFFDNLVIEQIQDLTRTVHSPAKQPGPLLKKDRPWERTPYFTANGWSVLRDRTSGEFRCWYEDWHIDPKEVARQGVVYCCFSPTSYARSADGLNWEKPELDYFEHNGRKTNIVLGDPSSFVKLESATVFEDPLDPDPQRRFKMLLNHYIYAKDRVKEELAGTRDGRDGLSDIVTVEMHYSGDGLRWTPSPELPRFGQHGNGLGDCYIVLPDPETGIYRLVTRAAGMESVYYDERRPRTNSFFPPLFPHDVARNNKRRIFLSESVDLIHWSRPQCILNPEDIGANLDESYYHMTHFRLGEVYVGLLNVLHQVANTMEVYLVYSRDGWNWHHANPGRPWLSPMAGSWDASMVNVSSPPIAVGEDLFVFHGGASNHHDWWITGLREGLTVPEAHSLEEARYGLGLAKMRLDGYVSVDAGAVREGVLVTRALRTDSRKLVLNAVCGKGGYTQVEVTDAEERVLDGCARAECDTFSGDGTKATITWKRRADIPHDGSLRLRFFMRNASLYSFALV